MTPRQREIAHLKASIEIQTPWIEDLKLQREAAIRGLENLLEPGRDCPPLWSSEEIKKAENELSGMIRRLATLESHEGKP